MANKKAQETPKIKRLPIGTNSACMDHQNRKWLSYES